MRKFTVGFLLLLAALLNGCGEHSSILLTPTLTITLTSVSPNQAIANSAAFTLEGTGSNFTAESVLKWNDTPLTTQFISSTQLSVTIPAALTGSVGTFQISVADPNLSISGSSQAFSLIAQPSNSGLVQSLVSVTATGLAGNGNSGPVAFSSDSRYVAFASYANNLAPGASSRANVYLRDTCGGVNVCTPSTNLVSGGIGGSLANADSGEDSTQVSSLSVSGGGRYVAFESDASNLTGNDSNGVGDIFVHDNCTGAIPGCASGTYLISLSTQGIQANAVSANPSMSSDGRYVAFASQATNLVSGVTSGIQNIYLRDTCFGATTSCSASTTLVSQSSSGTPSDGVASAPSISADGRFVVFESKATTLVSQALNGLSQIYLRDTCAGASPCSQTTTLISVSTTGGPANAGATQASISGLGRYVAFAAGASNLVSSTSGDYTDIYVRDTCLGATGCVNSTIRVTTGLGGIYSLPSLSQSGLVIAFNGSSSTGSPPAQAYASLVCFPSVSSCKALPIVLSTGSGGAQANFNVGLIAISPDGHSVVFASGASNLSSINTGNDAQIYEAQTTY